MQLPQGVSLSPLEMHNDERGWLAEIFRDEWADSEMPCQWNANFSHPNVLRGVHGHYRHWDYLVALRGRISAGLYDARRKAPSYGMSAVIEIAGERLMALRIPPGGPARILFSREHAICLRRERLLRRRRRIGVSMDGPGTAHRLAMPQPGGRRTRSQCRLAGRDRGPAARVEP